ncbi:MAG: ATP-binding protein [Halanaeroarchaeum sp.]
MTFVLGRSVTPGPTAALGHFLATDGSRGASVALDLDRPHVGLVVGKRGSGKSYTLGVLAEELAATDGVAGVVVDPMGAFEGLAEAPGATVVDGPTVTAEALSPEGWCRLLGLDPQRGPGSLLWRVAAGTTTLAEMRTVVDAAGVSSEVRRAVRNHLDLAATWGVFDADGLRPTDLVRDGVTVLDVSTVPARARAAIVAAVADGLYDLAQRSAAIPLPWLLIDEAHVLTDSVATRALRTLLTRGRQPGVSLVLATQRPSALPDVAVSQADLTIAHRLTAGPDVDALARTNPGYLDGDLADRLPDGVGRALVVDDETESAVTVRVRERSTRHDGGTPRVSERRPPDRAADGVPTPGRSRP